MTHGIGHMGLKAAALAIALALLTPLMASDARADACTGLNVNAQCYTGNGSEVGTCDDEGNCISHTSGGCQPGDGPTVTCQLTDEEEGVCLNGTCVNSNATAVPDGTCTNDDTYKIDYPAPGQGLVSNIVRNIEQVLANVSRTMFNAIRQDQGFIKAVSALASIYVAVYGILFTFGIVQITIFDFVMRLIKLGIIAALLSGGAWGYFNDTIVKMFNEGTNELINKVSAIALGQDADGNAIYGGRPFVVLDNAIAEAVSSKTAITLMATFATGPYGPVIGLLLLMSIGSFLKALMNALWVYIMALVMRTLLFGLAPIFISCILFQRTRHLFDGWLNQIINASLQPIFLFTFFAFFCTLIKACLDQLLALNVCWTAWSEVVRGSPFSGHYWRFAIEDCNTGGWIPFDGIWDFTGANGAGICAGEPDAPGRVHPVGIMLPLTLWILADLASRFNHVVVEIAKDIAGASTELRMGSESVREWMGGGGGGGRGAGGGGLGAIGNRGAGPGGTGSFFSSGGGAGGAGGPGRGGNGPGNPPLGTRPLGRPLT